MFLQQTINNKKLVCFSLQKEKIIKLIEFNVIQVDTSAIRTRVWTPITLQSLHAVNFYSMFQRSLLASSHLNKPYTEMHL